MESSQSRAQGIKRLHASGASYRDIARTIQCSHATIADAIHSNMPPSPAIKRGRVSLTDARPDPDFRPFSREEDQFIVVHVNRMGNKWTRISQLFGEQFGARDRLAAKHRANWLIRDVEKAFLQHRLTLPPIEEILSIESGRGRRGGSESPFDPQQFFAG
jgi:hypothetical protein